MTLILTVTLECVFLLHMGAIHSGGMGGVILLLIETTFVDVSACTCAFAAYIGADYRPVVA